VRERAWTLRRSRLLGRGVIWGLVGLGEGGGESHAWNGRFGLGTVACGGVDEEGTATFLPSQRS
jgi:hypothetical protein